MELSTEFVSYNKVLVFGATGVGKSTLTKSIEKGIYIEEIHTENDILIYLL